MFDDLLSQTQVSRKKSIFYKSGIDCEEKCMDLKWFRSYPHAISYEINSMGFRDQEHRDLQGKIFAIGDSFSMGIGQPYDHTWPCFLESMIGESIVKLTSDGASNDWMRKVFDRALGLKPKAIFVMLSFLHRETIMTQNGTKHLQYDTEECYHQDWAEKMLQRTIENLDAMICSAEESSIPAFFTAVPEFDSICKSSTLRKRLISYPRLESIAPLRVFQRYDDLARDGYHFGKKTCESIANNLYMSYREKNR